MIVDSFFFFAIVLSKRRYINIFSVESVSFFQKVPLVLQWLCLRFPLPPELLEIKPRTSSMFGKSSSTELDTYALDSLLFVQSQPAVAWVLVMVKRPGSPGPWRPSFISVSVNSGRTWWVNILTSSYQMSSSYQRLPYFPNHHCKVPSGLSASSTRRWDTRHNTRYTHSQYNLSNDSYHVLGLSNFRSHDLCSIEKSSQSLDLHRDHTVK